METKERTQEAQQPKNAFGLTEEEHKKIKNFLPNFDSEQLKMGETVILKILENTPKEITYMDSKGLEKKSLAIKCLNITDGIECNLWISAISLKMGLQALSDKHNGKIENVTIKLSLRPYVHATFGKTKAYSVVEYTKLE